MPLTGQAKTDYQRKYMQRYRAKNKDSAVTGQKQASENARGLAVVAEPDSVRPVRPLKSVRPKPELVYIGDVLELTKARQTSRKGFNG